MQILLGNFYVIVGREDTFKPTMGNESLHEINNGNVFRVANFATSTNITAKNFDSATSITILGSLQIGKSKISIL
jgi:hypothetical protein